MKYINNKTKNAVNLLVKIFYVANSTQANDHVLLNSKFCKF